MKKSKLLSLGAGLAISLSTFVIANAHANPFQAEMLKAGYDNSGFTITKTAGDDGACGSADCSSDMNSVNDMSNVNADDADADDSDADDSDDDDSDDDSDDDDSDDLNDGEFED